MNKINNGGPAFPGGVNSAYTNLGQGEPTQEGMTLRDYFAAQVIGPIYLDFCQMDRNTAETVDPEWRIGLAHDAYSLADALLQVRTTAE